MKLGIDLGGTKIEIIALDDVGKNTFEECYRKRIATPQGNYQQTLQAIIKLVSTAESTLKCTGSIGIGIPGALSAQTNLVKNANSTCLIGNALQTDLEKLLKRDIRISNDANCMAISEAVDGAGKDSNVVFGVILGTGVGGGLCINNQVIQGKNLIAGEWGHNPLPLFTSIANRPEKTKIESSTIKKNTSEVNHAMVNCYCGKQNCIETFLSGPGLINRFKLENGIAETVPDIIKLCEQGNQQAEKLMYQYEDNLAKALASVINILDPDAIILAGGLSNIQRLYSNIPKLWGQYIFSDYISTQLLPAKHGDSTGVRGAAWLW